MSFKTEETVHAFASDLIIDGNAQAAVQELRLALEEFPYAGKLWELCGLAEMGCKNISASVAAFEEATSLIPLADSARFALAHGYEQLGRRKLARDLYIGMTSNLESLPVEILEPLACGLGRVSEPKVALEVCEAAAKQMPVSTAPLMGIVFYKRQLNTTDKEILPVLTRAFHLNPEDMQIRITLARTLHEYGLNEQAAELLAVTSIEEMDCPNCLAAMQSIFDEIGDQENASRCLNALIAIAIR